MSYTSPTAMRVACCQLVQIVKTIWPQSKEFECIKFLVAVKFNMLSYMIVPKDFEFSLKSVRTSSLYRLTFGDQVRKVQKKTSPSNMIY